MATRPSPARSTAASRVDQFCSDNPQNRARLCAVRRSRPLASSQSAGDQRSSGRAFSRVAVLGLCRVPATLPRTGRVAQRASPTSQLGPGASAPAWRGAPPERRSAGAISDHIDRNPPEHLQKERSPLRLQCRSWPADVEGVATSPYVEPDEIRGAGGRSPARCHRAGRCDASAKCDVAGSTGGGDSRGPTSRSIDDADVLNCRPRCDEIHHEAARSAIVLKTCT